MRAIDDLGRIVIPKDIREKLNIKANDTFNIYEDNGLIILEPSTKRCYSCKSTENVAQCGDVTLCIDCAKRISNNIKEQFDIK